MQSLITSITGLPTANKINARLGYFTKNVQSLEHFHFRFVTELYLFDSFAIYINLHIFSSSKSREIRVYFQSCFWKLLQLLSWVSTNSSGKYLFFWLLNALQRSPASISKMIDAEKCTKTVSFLFLIVLKMVC